MKLNNKQLLILSLLISNPNPLYGLELIDLSNNKLRLGVIYVDLTVLEENKLVISYLETLSEHKLREGYLRRRLYSITKLGTKTYLENSKSFNAQYANPTLGL